MEAQWYVCVGPTEDSARRLARAAARPHGVCFHAGNVSFRTWLAAALRVHHQRDPVVALATTPAAAARLPVGQRRMVERLLGAYGAIQLVAGPAGAAGSSSPRLASEAQSAPGGLPWPSAPPARVLASGSKPSGASESRRLSRGTGFWPRPGGPPVALLVGDRLGAGWPARLPEWPFTSLRASGCSSWLGERLEAAGVPERQLCWVEAYRRDGEPHDTSWLVEHAPLFAGVVALGRHAARWVASVEVPFVEVHHPMHWKRFHFKDEYVLGKRLQRMLLQNA